jgi:hypothetical protein
MQDLATLGGNGQPISTGREQLEEVEVGLLRPGGEGSGTRDQVAPPSSVTSNRDHRPAAQPCWLVPEIDAEQGLILLQVEALQCPVFSAIAGVQDRPQ